MRAEVVGGETFAPVTGLLPVVCKSMAKVSKLRILHLPPRLERSLDAQKRRSGALSCCSLLTAGQHGDYAGADLDWIFWWHLDTLELTDPGLAP